MSNNIFTKYPKWQINCIFCLEFSLVGRVIKVRGSIMALQCILGGGKGEPSMNEHISVAFSSWPFCGGDVGSAATSSCVCSSWKISTVNTKG